MSEYIVAGAEPNNTVLKSITKNGYEHEMWLPVREEIVRCRDCVHYEEYVGSCTRRRYHFSVKPDGFCAWGERRAER